MHSFFIKCAILLVFVLTGQFAVAYVKNDSHRLMSPAKLFTHYLKVPWINLNSPWKDKVSPDCRDDIMTLFESADIGEMWALQMLDAASKIPAGIFIGNIRDLGMYEECIRVRADHNPANIQGRHCMISLSMPPKFVGGAAKALYIQKLSAYNPTPNVGLNFAASLCLPSSCKVDDIRGFVNSSIQATSELAELEVRVAKVTCSSVPGESDNFVLGRILSISFFIVITIFLVFCTICDSVIKVKPDGVPVALKTLAKFSLSANAIKLLSTKTGPESISAIHGIKFFSIFLVVMMHRLMSTMVKPLVNLSSMYEVRDSWLAPLIILIPLAVDTFFLISGCLTAYLFLSRLRSGKKFNILEVYLHRYLRLTPSIIALLLLIIFIIPYYGSGPLWEELLTTSRDFCVKNWWTNLLYIQNFVNREEMCIPHTWYTAVDMQLFWLCPIFLYPLFYRPRLGLVITSIFLITALIVPAVLLVVNQYSALSNFNKIIAVQYVEAINFYTVTYNRALPYLIGILLGHYLLNNKTILTKVQAAINWTMVCIFITFCVWSSYFLQPIAIDYNIVWEAAFVSLGRLGWSLSVAWIIYACMQGYGGPVTRILSKPIFVPFSRLSYGMYLVSILLQFGLNATEQSAEYYSKLKVFYLVLSDLIASIIAAFFLNLFFESPVVVLEKILRSRGPSKIIECPSTEKKEKLGTVREECPHTADSQVGSDLTVHKRMLQPDFWHIVSDALKTLGKRPTKTPAEWVQTWRDWKSNQSKNNDHWKTSPNDIQNKSDKLETGLTTLEKELLIFLTAVNWGSDDVVKSKEPMKLHSDFCGLPSKVFGRKFVRSASAQDVYRNARVDEVPCQCNTPM